MDQAVFHLINEQWTHPALDLFMAAISDVEIWKPILIGVAVFVLIFTGFKGRAFLVCLLLALVFADYALVSTLKTAINRRRPKQVQKVRMVQLERTQPAFLTLFKQPTIRYSDESDRTKSGPSFPSSPCPASVSRCLAQAISPSMKRTIGSGRNGSRLPISAKGQASLSRFGPAPRCLATASSASASLARSSGRPQASSFFILPGSS